jgi:hypothetical protein
MASPAAPVTALPPRRPRGRVGPALAVAAAVLWGHALLITSVGDNAPRRGDRPAAVNTLQVRRLVDAAPLAVPLPRPERAPAVPAKPRGLSRRADPSAPANPPATASTAVPAAAAAETPAAVAPEPAVSAATPEGIAAAAAGTAPPPPIYATRLPAPVQLRYALRYNGQAGEALLSWRHDGARYTLTLDGQASSGAPLVTQASQGAIDGAGLAPERFVDRRRRAPLQAANFRRDIGRIGFSGPAVDYPAWPGAQDRLSWLAQLAAILAAGPVPPALQLFVVDARGAGSLWQLQRQDDERLATPGGEATVQVWQRDPPRPEGLQVRAWIDAARGHWPVQLRFTALRSGDIFELRLLAEPAPPP